MNKDSINSKFLENYKKENGKNPTENEINDNYEKLIKEKSIQDNIENEEYGQKEYDSDDLDGDEDYGANYGEFDDLEM